VPLACPDSSSDSDGHKMEEEQRLKLLEFVGSRRLPIFGTKGSGKTTFVRNLRCSSRYEYFNEGELLTFKETIRKQVEETLYKAITAVTAKPTRKKTGGKGASPSAMESDLAPKRVKEAMEHFSEYYLAETHHFRLSDPNVKMLYGEIQHIWGYAPIKKWVADNRADLPENIEYFLDKQ
jgi:hypothetical protein